jgi:hypothetical protein
MGYSMIEDWRDEEDLVSHGWQPPNTANVQQWVKTYEVMQQPADDDDLRDHEGEEGKA